MSHTNRFLNSTGEQALDNCDRLKLDLWKRDNGQICVNYEIHGSIGESIFDDEDDEGEGETATIREPTDISLVFDLLRRLQQIGGVQ